MALAQYFLQKVTINNTEIAREDVMSCCYMEIDDLEGPQIELVISDRSGRMVDNLGIKYGSTMICTLGDPDGSGALWQDTFFILEAPARNDTITVIALVDAVRKLHAPAAKAQFFTNQQPADVLAKLVNGELAPVADSFNVTGTWHLNNGEEPVGVIRRMAQDSGAIAWVAKSKINVKGINQLLNKGATFTYEAMNPKANLHILRYQILNADYAASQAHDYRYVGFSQTEGQKSGGGEGAPVKMVADTDPGVLKNRTIGLIPKLDMEIAGNAAMSVGDVINVKLHRDDGPNTLNEAIPSDLVVMRVTHYETRFNYRCRAILGVTYDQMTGLKGMKGGGALGEVTEFFGSEGFNIDGFDLGGFLEKLDQGIEVGLETINDAIQMVNAAEHTIRDAAGSVIKIATDTMGNVIKETTDKFGNVIREVTDKAGVTVKTIIKDVTGIGGGSGGNPPGGTP
jgi:hypothetical protein